MNKISASISSIETEGPLAIIGLNALGIPLKAIVIENVENHPHLQVGNTATALFKETEVVLAKALSGKLSMENCISAQVEAITKETLLSKVSLQTSLGYLHAVITSTALADMQLVVGDHVEALVKTNEIMLSY